MKRSFVLFSLLFFLFISHQTHAQAFDGPYDLKWRLTSSLQSHRALGIELGLEFGVSDYVSLGVVTGFTVIHGPIHRPPVKEGQLDLFDEEEAHSEEGGYISLIANFHYGELIGMSDEWDMYSGFNILKNFGFQTGIRYHIWGPLGLMAEANIPIVTRLFHRKIKTNFLEDYETPMIMLGITLGY